MRSVAPDRKIATSSSGKSALAERLEAAMFGVFDLRLLSVGLAEILEGPAWAHIADKTAGTQEPSRRW
jgi:hypothetical protein